MRLTVAWVLVAVLAVVVETTPAILFPWFGETSPAACCRRRLVDCCPLFNHHIKPVVEVVNTRPWPILSNDAFTPEELEQRRQARRALRERMRDRQRDKDSRRNKEH